MHKICTLIKLSYLAENRALRTDKQSSSALLDMILIFLKHLQKDFDLYLPICGINFVIETFKLMRFEVINDGRQVMLSGLLNFLEAYINYYSQKPQIIFSSHIVGLDAFLIFEIIDTSKFINILLIKS